MFTVLPVTRMERFAFSSLRMPKKCGNCGSLIFLPVTMGYQAEGTAGNQQMDTLGLGSCLKLGWNKHLKKNCSDRIHLWQKWGSCCDTKFSKHLGVHIPLPALHPLKITYHENSAFSCIVRMKGKCSHSHLHLPVNLNCR